MALKVQSKHCISKKCLCCFDATVRDRTQRGGKRTRCRGSFTDTTTNTQLMQASQPQPHNHHRPATVLESAATDTHHFTAATVNTGCGCSGELETASTRAADVSHTPEVPYSHLLDLHLEDTSGRWHLYHTPTGRLTGFLRERQRRSHKETGQTTQPPWKPPYASPTHGPDFGITSSRTRGIDSMTVMAATGTTGGSPPTDTADGVHVPQCHVNATYNVTIADHVPPWTTHATITSQNTVENDQSVSYPTSNMEGTNGLHSSRGRELLVTGAELRHKASIMSER